MAWIESHQSLRNHPKVLRLASELRVHKTQIIGHLHFLWWWALEYAPEGDISAFTSTEIAAAADWQGDVEKFRGSLVKNGWLDNDGCIHDWQDYAGKLIEYRERGKEQNRERQRRFREKKKLNEKTTRETSRVTNVMRNAPNNQHNKHNITNITNITNKQDKNLSKAPPVLHGVSLNEIVDLKIHEKTRLLDRDDLLMFFKKTFNCNVSRDVFLSIVALYGVERARDTVLRMSAKKDQIRMPVAFLKAALSKDWSLTDM